MATIPTQEICLQPWADHRFTNSFNKFTRILTGGNDYVLPFDYYTCKLSYIDTTSIQIDTGMVIKDDALIIFPEVTTLDFTEPLNYVGNIDNYNFFGKYNENDLVHPMKYLILLNYHYDRSYPGPNAYFTICKDREFYFQNKQYFIYLGSINVVLNNEDYPKSASLTNNISDFDYEDYLDFNTKFEKPILRINAPFIQCGWIQ